MSEKNLQQTASSILESVQKEYSTLTGITPAFSLLELFNFEGFNLETYCQVFSPHPDTPRLVKEARAFGERFGIWLNNAEHYITCATYLFPHATPERMGAILQNCAIDFYLNDTVGREVFPHLSPEEQEKGSKIRERMYHLREDLYVADDQLTPVELANAEMLTYIRDTSSFSWFREFLRLYNYHIHVAHMDCNAATMGRIPTVDEYMYNRGHISGMFHTIALIEYGTGQFLDWEWLNAIGVDGQLKRLYEVVSGIGCLMNDLFSFEKEVIINQSDSNLVMALMLNQPGLLLTDAISAAAAVVRSHLIEFLALTEYVEGEVQQAAKDNPEQLPVMQAHFSGLERCVQASWIWQVYTQRYKSAHSIFNETRLSGVYATR